MDPIEDDRLTNIKDILLEGCSEDAFHCVLGVVRCSKYQEIPSKRTFYENYCLLDMEIADHTCTPNQTLSVRLWGNITRDHLRHRFVEGSVVLLVGVHLKRDKFKDKLILQQLVNNRSVSFVLCETLRENGTTNQTNLAMQKDLYFDGGNALYPMLYLTEERYPKLTRKLELLRKYCSEGEDISANSDICSTRGLTKLGVDCSIYSVYVGDLLQAAAVTAGTVDICVAVPLQQLNYLAEDAMNTERKDVGRDTDADTDRGATHSQQSRKWRFPPPYLDNPCTNHKIHAQKPGVFQAVRVSDVSGGSAILEIADRATLEALKDVISTALDIPFSRGSEDTAGNKSTEGKNGEKKEFPEKTEFQSAGERLRADEEPSRSSHACCSITSLSATVLLLGVSVRASTRGVASVLQATVGIGVSQFRCLQQDQRADVDANANAIERGDQAPSSNDDMSFFGGGGRVHDEVGVCQFLVL